MVLSLALNFLREQVLTGSLALFTQDFWPYQPDLGRDWEVEELDELEAYQRREQTSAAPDHAFTWSPVTGGTAGPMKAKNVLIGLNGAGALFLLAHFTPQNAVATLQRAESPKEDDSLHFPRSEKHQCTIYSTSNMILVLCHYEVKPEEAWEWTQTLFEHVDGDRVVVFDDFTVGQYRTRADDLYPPLVRKVESSKADPVADDIKYLEPPTIVTGPSAAILTHRQLRNREARIYLSLREQYLGKNEVVSETLEAFEGPLKAVLGGAELGQPIGQGKAKYREVLEKHVGKPRESALYI
ncbi:hypothetical protein HK097_005279 [Rhizophlyctis rosea]|uniref:Proteasome assembly chaperone 1 n=1 Tax=Rhizophlyctis rosea TaxID=64517 RepID=A0AAD5SFK7_9FUNG|nr:hypothetical protein HK097_005279 [Rhizophlyctis rosea]